MSEIRLGVLARCVAASFLAVALVACGNGTSSVTLPPLGASALSGSYVFTASGTNATDGDYSVIGSFVADGKGNITSGVADYNLGSGVDENVPLTGTYTVTTGTASVALTDGGSVNDTFTTTLVNSGTANVQNFDGTGSGTLYPQTVSGFSAPGSYSFSLAGEGDGVISGSGEFTASATGPFSAGDLTFTDAQAAQSYSTIAGFLGSPGTGGRGFANIEGNNLAYYVIGPKQIQMLGLDERILLTVPAQKQ
jgi:hypothetical protein